MLKHVDEIELLNILRDIEEFSNNNECDVMVAGVYIANNRLHHFADKLPRTPENFVTYDDCIRSYFDGLTDSKGASLLMADKVNHLIDLYNRELKWKNKEL